MENKSLIFLVIGAIFFPILIVACFVTDKEFLFAKEPTDIFQLIEEEGEPTKNAYVSIDVDASLEEGEMNVYIGVNGEKELLLTVKGGESYDEVITLDGKYDKEKTVYIILESAGKCAEGDFEFEYN